MPVNEVTNNFSKVNAAALSGKTPDSQGSAFTAAQIAAVLGKFPQVIRRWLKDIRADSSRVERRKLAAVWAITSLPVFVQVKLEAKRRDCGLEAIEDLFASQPVWQPEFPWNEVCGEHQEQALKLQRALLPILERRHNSLIKESELFEIGLRQYRAEFQRDIKPDQWRYLYDRTLERDRGYEQFHRPELFLPGNLKRAMPVATPDATDFESLNLTLGKIRDPQNPTTDEIDAVWMDAVAQFEELTESKKSAKAKRQLLEFLWRRAPFLAKTKNALRVNFDRKLKAWRESQGDEAALLDGRALKRGEKRAPEIPQADINLIAGYSHENCGNRTTQAVRELGQIGECSGLSAETLALINNPHKNKSHVNRRLFNTVHCDVEAIAPFRLGKKAIDDATPSLQRDYSRQRSMDTVTMDDFTMPVYFFVPDGKGWWELTRGQCLLSVDCRSLKIIYYSLQPERNYNSLVIRTLMNRTCQEHGLPREWYFENGMWRKAKVVKGAPKDWSEGKSDAELQPGWAKLGVKFTHTQKARAKTVELVGGKLQNLMERCLGYCGRNEVIDCPDITKRNILAVKAKRVDPHGLFYGFDAWNEELGKLVALYNNDPQQGRILAGLSPAQAFEQYWPNNDPPVKFGASCWHLLAHYVSEREVGVEGIKFKISGEGFIYRDENSSALRGKKVLAWFNPECPELLGVTDLNERNPALVQRAYPVDFRAASDRGSGHYQVYQTELAKVAGHNSYPKARYNVIKAGFKQTFRGNLVAPGVAHVAEAFSAGREQIENREREKTRRVNATAKRAAKLGLPPALVRPGDELSAKGLEMMEEAESAIENTGSQINYELQPPKNFKPKGKK